MDMALDAEEGTLEDDEKAHVMAAEMVIQVRLFLTHGTYGTTSVRT